MFSKFLSGSVERIDIHGIFHNMVQENDGKLTRSIHDRLVSRSANGNINSTSIKLIPLDPDNLFVPFSNYVDGSHQETSVR